MKIKNYVTRAFAPVAICLALILLPLVPVSIAGASGSSSIVGTVTDASNPLGLLGVCVTVLTPGGASVGTSTTLVGGAYEVDLSAGIYVVEFDPTCDGSVTSPDVGQYDGGVYSLGTATQITVGTNDQETANATLAASGSIAGTVTDAADPSGLAGVCVTATDASDTIGASGTATTATGGTYSITGLAPGSFQVFFDPTCGNTQSSPDFPLWYSNSLTEGGATSVPVSSGNTFTANASLETFGSIAGTVVDASHPGGLAGVCVTATSSTGGSGVGDAVTTSNGTYAITELPPDAYTVEFDPSCGGTVTSPDYPQWYSGAVKQANATSVEVSSGAATANVNASLTTAGSISGTVTDSFHPNGLNGVCVSTISSDGGSGGGVAVTGANGTYTISGLEPDSYLVTFDPTCSGHDSTHDVPKSYGSAVTVSSGAVTPGINTVLATIPGLSSNTAVTSNANPGSVDTPIIYYATVTPTDNGGTVAFTDNGQPVNTCAAQPVVATVATCTITYPGVGSHEIGAAYTGDEGYAASNSTEFDETIQSYVPPPTPSNPTKTTTLLTSNANPSLIGSVTYTAAVSPTDNDGTVSFFDASAPIAGCQDVAIQQGSATCLVISPSFGSHSISASFSGSPGYDPSTSSTLDEAVLLTTTTSITSSYNPAGDTAGITFTATTSPSPDGGTMQFEMNGAMISGCPLKVLVKGASTCKVKNLRPGTHIVTAVYSGDSDYQTSASTTFSEKVLRNSVVTVQSSKGVAKKGATIRFVAKVAKKYGTGFLSFAENGRTIGNCKKVKLRRGVGVCTVRDLSVGRHIVSVAFSGNSNFGPSYNGLLEVIKK